MQHAQHFIPDTLTNPTATAHPGSYNLYSPQLNQHLPDSYRSLYVQPFTALPSGHRQPP
jgi:hypothetical protein